MHDANPARLVNWRGDIACDPFDFFTVIEDNQTFLSMSDDGRNLLSRLNIFPDLPKDFGVWDGERIAMTQEQLANFYAYSRSFQAAHQQDLVDGLFYALWGAIRQFG
jgi:hypothetical protein